jgi:hypothetical protein
VAASRIDVIPLADALRWHEVLSQTDGFDVYHLPEYHTVAQETPGNQGVLFVYRESHQMLAWPFVLRPIGLLPGLEAFGCEIHDATSVYGYPGPVCTRSARGDLGFFQRSASALNATARDLNWVSCFSRLNPILENSALVGGLGEIIEMGETVSIILSLGTAEYLSGLRKSHRHEIKHARQLGLRTYYDVDWSAFEDFIRLYTLTMDKVQASRQYYFDREYFIRLRQALVGRVHLFVAEKDGAICSAALFILTNEIMQYHLSGSDPAYAAYSPSKVVIDEARLWGTSSGARYLHLGGGVGSRQDTLFQFKAGFSSTRHKFAVWKCVVFPGLYTELVQARIRWATELGLDVSHSYFPQYRAFDV